MLGVTMLCVWIAYRRISEPGMQYTGLHTILMSYQVLGLSRARVSLPQVLCGKTQCDGFRSVPPAPVDELHGACSIRGARVPPEGVLPAVDGTQARVISD